MESDVVALTSLVDNLFLLTRIEAGELEIDRSRVDVGELADEAIEVLAAGGGQTWSQPAS